MSAAEPSEKVYPDHIRFALRRAELELAGDGLRRFMDAQVGEKMTDAFQARLRRQVASKIEQILRRLLPYDYDRVRWHLLFEVEEHGRRVAMAVSVPLYVHDCDACEYLGRFTPAIRVAPAETVDLYTCMNAGYRTFVCRYGDDGPDYSSAPIELCFRENAPAALSPFNEALRRWRMQP